jgi:hypothetical protein
MKMIQYEESEISGTKEVVSGKKTNMKDYLEAKKKAKTVKKPTEVLAPGEVSEIERNFAKYFPKDLI